MARRFFPKTTVEVTIGGRVFNNWKSLEINRTIENLVGTATLDIAVDDTTAFDSYYIVEGATFGVRVVAEDQRRQKTETPMMTGWVVGIDESLTENGWSISLSAADLTIDLAQCSVVVDRYEWRNARLGRIVRDICKPYDIYVDGSAADYHPFPIDGVLLPNTQEFYEKPFKEFVAKPDETAASVISRAARARGVMVTSDQFGQLRLDRSKYNEPATTRLIYGTNMYDLSRKRSDNYRFSDYTCYGQVSGKGQKWGVGTTTLNAKAKDENLGRYRPKVFQIENNVSKKVIQDRVNWEAQVRAGRSASYTCSVPNWFYHLGQDASSNRSFQLNSNVSLRADKWNLDEKLMISQVTFSATNAGRKTSLTLVDPKTYAAAPGSIVEKKVKKTKKRKTDDESTIPN